MKKRVLALLMAGVMVMGCPVMAMAEEAAAETEMEGGEVLAVDYSMIDETVYEGTWVSAFGVFDLYLPSDWEVLINADLDAEAPEDGIYFQAANEDQTHSVAISCAAGDLTSLEDLAAYCVDQGFDEVAYAVVNDIPVVTYAVLTEGVQTIGLAALGDQGGIYNVTYGAVEGDADFEAIARNILCSFSATEYEAETE